MLTGRILCAVLGCAAILVMFLAGLPRVHAEEGAIKVACIGDSITFGAGVEDRDHNSYPAVLGKLLGAQYRVENYGVSGATLLRKGDLPYWSRAEFKTATDFAPQIVIIKLGTNDSKPQNWRHQADFAKDMVEMAGHFAALPSKPKVFLCLPVPAYADAFGISAAIIKSQVIPLIQQVAATKKLPVIDLFTALSGHPEMFPDKIHPNAAGAALMAKAVAAAITGK